MQKIISDILEWCQNDMEYLQELIDNLQDIVDTTEDDESNQDKFDVCGYSKNDLMEDLYNSKLDEAKQLINEFCENEYGDSADFTDLQNVDVAYTVTEDSEEIQVTLDLINLELRQYVDGELYDKIIYRSLEDMIDKDLKHLDFDELVRL